MARVEDMYWVDYNIDLKAWLGGEGIAQAALDFPGVEGVFGIRVTPTVLTLLVADPVKASGDVRCRAVSTAGRVTTKTMRIEKGRIA